MFIRWRNFVEREERVREEGVGCGKRGQGVGRGGRVWEEGAGQFLCFICYYQCVGLNLV